MSASVENAGSLPEYIPYWTTLPVRVKANSAIPGGLASVLVLKDGTLALGLKVRGADLYTASNAVLNAYTAAISRALRGLPSDTYLQSVFETGGRFDDLVDRFKNEGAAKSAHLLERGRTLQAEALRTCEDLSRSEITYWIGWRRALKAISGWRRRALRQNGQPTEHVRRATQLLVDAATRFADALRFVGLDSEFFDERRILDACHRAINPTSHHLFPAPRYVETPDDLENWGAGKPMVLRGPALASQLPLGDLCWNDTQLVMGEPPIMARVLNASKLADTTTPRSLHEAMFTHQPARPFRLVVTHNPTSKELSVTKLKVKRALAFGTMGGGLIDHEARKAYNAQDELIEDLSGHDAQLFETSITAVVHGYDEYELDQATRDVFDGLQEHGIVSSTLLGDQLNGWLATLPANGHTDPNPVKLLDRSCAHLTPIWQPSLGDAAPEMLFRNRQRGLEALSVRIGAVREQAGAVALGSTNSGKTLLMQKIAKMGCLNLGGHVTIWDVKGPGNSTYLPMCRELGGVYSCLESADDATCNSFPNVADVFDKNGAFIDTLLEPAILALCLMAMPKYDDPDRDYWETVATETLKRAYRANVSNPRPLILQDVIDAFDGYDAEFPKTQAIAADMRERLQTFLNSPMRKRLFNKPQSLDMSNPLLVFDFAGMQQDPRAAMILLAGMASSIEAKLRRLPKTTPKLFIFDEAWKILEDSEAGRKLLAMLYRIARSYGAAAWVVTQHENDILSSSVGQAIMSNSSLRLLLRRIDGHEAVAEAFNLDERQLELFKSLKPKPGPYSEFLLVDTHESRTQVLQYWPTPFDLWCDTSRPADVELRNKRMKDTGRTYLEVVEELAQEYPAGAPAGAQKEAA